MIIGLCGQAGSGKSTVAGILQERGFVLHKFATPLKNMLRAIGLTEAQIEGDEKETPCALLSGATPRCAMQTLGMEWGRGLHVGLWTNMWREKLPKYHNIVCDDVRFNNEAKLITSLGGWIVHINRGGISAIDHASEGGLQIVDCEITNNGTIADLEHEINYTITALLWQPDDRNARVLRYA